MRNITIGALIVLFAAGIACAEDKNFGPKDKFCVLEKTPTATSPVGALVETTDLFVGKIASAVEIAVTGERKITVENETGECRIFPFSATTKVVDATFNTVTFDQLKKGENVKVKYTEDAGIAKAAEVTVEK